MLSKSMRALKNSVQEIFLSNSLKVPNKNLCVRGQTWTKYYLHRNSKLYHYYYHYFNRRERNDCLFSRLFAQSRHVLL